MTLRRGIYAAATLLSVVSTIAVAVAPGEGPFAARAVLAGGLAILAVLMAFLYKYGA
jgi:hypothetical protein